MDICRCEEYAEAVRNLRIYTVGTYFPDRIAKYDRSGFAVSWKKKQVTRDDATFIRPKARVVQSEAVLPGSDLSEESRKVKNMWCPFMTPIKIYKESL